MFRFEDPFIVYGWRERNQEYVINTEWAEQNNFRIYSSDLAKNLATEAVYGEACELNSKSAKVTIDKISKKNVEMAYAKYVEYAHSLEKECDDLGYYLALDGDMDWSQKKTYIPCIGDHSSLLIDSITVKDRESDEETVVEEKPKKSDTKAKRTKKK